MAYVPTPLLRWRMVPDHSGRPAVTEHTHWRDGDGWVLQQWWGEGQASLEEIDNGTAKGEWRDVPMTYDYGS